VNLVTYNIMQATIQECMVYVAEHSVWVQCVGEGFG